MSRLTFHFADERKLKRWTRKVDRAAGRGGLLRLGRKWTRAEAKKNLPAVRRRTPVDTGTLRKGLTVRKAKAHKNAVAHAVVTPTRERLARRPARRGRKSTGRARLGRRTNLRILRGKGYYPMAIEYGTRHNRAFHYLRDAGIYYFPQFRRNIARHAKVAFYKLLKVQ